MKSFLTLLFCCSVLWAAPTHAASALDQLRAAAASETEDDFLAIDEAFKLDTSMLDGMVLVRFTIADGYYLYRDRFSVKSEQAQLGALQLPEGELKHDEFLGDQIVYHRFVELRVPVTAHSDFDINVGFQGCAEKGLCYPPTKRKTRVSYHASTDVVATPNDAPVTAKVSAGAASGGDLAQLIGGNLWMAFWVAIVVGMGLTFTPCVLPMIPITLGIIGAQGSSLSKSRAVVLVMVYVQAMAASYALLGIAVASAGAALQGYLQNPWVISVSALVFVLLSLSMFGAYELQLPSRWQEKLMSGSSQQKQGSLIGVAIMGALSALIVSPCVSAPLAGALVYIAQTGEQLRGAVALYGLGLGMGVPLFIAGVGGARLLPKAGAWMDRVKHVFGFGLIAVAITLINRLLPGSIALALWGVLALALAQFLMVLSPRSAWLYWVRALQWCSAIVGVLYIVGAFSGNDDPVHPIRFGSANTATISSTEKIDPHALFKPIKTIADVEREIAAANAAGKTVMLDFFADWCVACFEFAKYTFPQPDVQFALQNTVLLQADVTANDEADRALLSHYQVKGLPSILFFDRNGQEWSQQRVTGFLKADAFAQHLSFLRTP